MRTAGLLMALAIFFSACASKNANDELFSGEFSPINSQEIKKSLGGSYE